ncbi:MAG: DUF420 domain-containing protein [bacterium]
MNNPLPATGWVKDHPKGTTVVLTVLGYGLVLGTLYRPEFGFLYPDIQLDTVNVLSHLIALNNLVATICLILGWYWIRQGDVKKHPWAMSTAFCLIILFLVLYLLKTGGGGRKEFIGPPVAWWSYVTMLGVHIILSIISVPVVLYTFILGTTRSIPEIKKSIHAKVGRWAGATWIVSLMLGVVAYVLLNHVYSYEFVRM